MVAIVGNSPVDLIAEVGEEFLAREGLQHGVCTTIDAGRQARFLDAAAWHPIPGGCGANIAVSLALLGNEARLIAPFGNDRYADLTRESLLAAGVELIECPLPTSGQLIFTFLTPDGDRSFATYYDPDTAMPAARIVAAADRDLLLIDGYILQHPAYRRELLAAVAVIDAAARIVFCPNDISVIDDAGAACAALIERATHIVMNRREMAHLFPNKDRDATIAYLQGRGKSGVVTLGAEGALLFDPAATAEIPSALDPADFVDSNGAGDAFTAGYVHGLVHGLALAEAGALAARCAAAVLATRGARPPARFAEIALNAS
jgi:sugar/nucleoside kinase (ribokinase family)